MADNRDGDGGRDRREPRLRDILARRLFTEGEEEAHPHEERARDDRGRMDAREMLGAVLDTGDKAKTEVVRMIAREVRSYLEALQVGDDIHDLLTNYSLEVHASLHLRPLREEEKEERDASAPSELSAGLKRRQSKKGRRAAAREDEEPPESP